MTGATIAERNADAVPYLREKVGTQWEGVERRLIYSLPRLFPDRPLSETLGVIERLELIFLKHEKAASDAHVVAVASKEDCLNAINDWAMTLCIGLLAEIAARELAVQSAPAV
ncbi:hypothetical protein SAMN05444678_11693 [Sphingomonas sp. YR710]|uniref:hypothetical protein n=1 Tax=Sphingomonas sp. YR710 TaxID=1882773 RepID=UPI00088EFA01|nr:hypothetical protein [Sphingomonas sp. YR710]SDD58795.1 hypothetical protein SAMN05444678_11693 [Sphingomonas sp. YR710]